jgi:putative chitinase
MEEEFKLLITIQQLRACMPRATELNLGAFIVPLNDTCEKFNINTPKRIASFLAQLAHESGCLKYTLELASGKDYDTGKKAANLGNTPEADGDGQKYKGRGLIQITGLANYKALSKFFGMDFVSTPSLLCTPEWAAMSAGWFWNSKNINYFADLDRFKTVTKKINGGLNGYAERYAYWILARKAFGITEPVKEEVV